MKATKRVDAGAKSRRTRGIHRKWIKRARYFSELLEAARAPRLQGRVSLMDVTHVGDLRRCFTIDLNNGRSVVLDATEAIVERDIVVHFLKGDVTIGAPMGAEAKGRVKIMMASGEHIEVTRPPSTDGEGPRIAPEALLGKIIEELATPPRPKPVAREKNMLSFFDLEDPLLQVRGAVDVVRVCEESGDREAIGAAVNFLLAYFGRLEKIIKSAHQPPPDSPVQRNRGKAQIDELVEALSKPSAPRSSPA